MGFVTGYPLFRLPIISMVLCAQEESMLVCFGNLGEPESSLTGIAGYNNQGDINNRYLMHQNLQQTQTGFSGLRYKKKALPSSGKTSFSFCSLLDFNNPVFFSFFLSGLFRNIDHQYTVLDSRTDLVLFRIVRQDHGLLEF